MEKRKAFLFIAILVSLFVLLCFNGCAGGTGDDDDDDDDDDGEEGEGESEGEGEDDPGTIISDDSELKADGVDPVPPLHLDPERPTSNSPVSVTVEVADSTGVTITFEGGGCGTLTTQTGVSPMIVTGTSAASGFCSIKADVQMAAEVQHMEASFEIQASEPAIPPIAIDGAVYQFSAFPAASGVADAPVVSTISGPESFINGSSSNFSLAFTSSRSVSQMLVQVSGFDGYFLLPVPAESSSVDFKMSFDDDIMERLGGEKALKEGGAVLQMLVSLVDAAGAIGNAYNWMMSGVEVASGDVKASISWDTATDVDLHVIEPDGTEIYYSNRNSSSGGSLDLDSNPGCNIDGVNNENIFWPAGQSPTGEYTVSAVMYSDCEQGGASGTITISYCGPDSPLVEAFSLGSTGSSQSWTINNTCAYKVSGTVKYEDFAVTSAGLSASGSMVPVRFITVQVVREEDEEVLAEGFTDTRGRYSIDFENDGESGYYVQVVAETDSERLKQKVTDLDGNLYSWRTEDSYDETETPDNKDINIEIKKDVSGAALNIWDVGVTTSTYAKIYGGATLPAIQFLWTDGQKPLGEDASFFTSKNKIYVLGDPDDSDCYDDIILGHEYGHFVMSAISRDDSPGGGHSSNEQSNPLLAMSEGWATFFGVTAFGGSTYIDTNKGGVGVYYSIETLPATKPLGNEGDKLDGNLSEAVAAAVLLDLFDSDNETKDTLSNIGVWNVITTYFKKDNSKFSDRGVAGVDLVDFLDGWFCLGYGEKGEDDSTGVRGNVKGLHKLSYDFTDLASCE